MYKTFLSLRYLRTRYIALASIVSVMLGVATMIVVNSVMKGFTSEMKNRIQGLLSDIVLETTSLDGQEDARRHFDLIRRAAGEKVAGMTATVEVWGLLSFQFGNQWTTRPITLIGIEPEGKATVGPLTQYLESYHELKEGNQVVRPPLRSRDQVPGWDLTAEAMDWRKLVVERRKWLEERMTPNDPKDGDEFDVAPAGLSQAAGRAPVVAPSPSPNPAPAPIASTTGGPPPKAAPGGGAPAETISEPDPFSPAGPDGAPAALPDTAPNAEPIDPTAPLAARVYAGVGLLRFPIEDPKTGRTRMVDMARPGDDVKISTVSAGRPPKPVHFAATIVDVFKCGMSEYDSNLVFCNLAELQRFRAMIDPHHPDDADRRAITSIQIKLKDYADAPQVVEQLQALFPPGLYTIKTWEQKQGPLLAAVEIETGILNVLLFLIIAVAGFGILAIFYMIVVEKTRDIGILKALGAGSGGVMSIFLSYGLALGVVGSGVGVLLGLMFVRYINEIESAIALVTGRKVFDDKIYYFPQIPTLVETRMVIWVTIGAIAIAVLASVLPARRAARLRPIESLRYE